ncbi:MAG: DUF3105 domain-containing protein [Actinomycetota bacterium]
MANKKARQGRRDTAKQQRAEHARRAARKQQVRKVVTLVIVVGALALGGIIVQGGNGGTKKVASLDTLAAAAGCSKLQSPPNQGREHLTSATTVDYNSNPPTSGTHSQSEANTGIHATPIPSELQVHNLEHGHVGIQYTDALPEAIRTKLEELTSKHDKYVFMAPRADMPYTLAFTAWTKLMTCEAPTDPVAVAAVAEKFRDVHEDQGPENNLPGTPN